jgi:hypothetical protein
LYKKWKERSCKYLTAPSSATLKETVKVIPCDLELDEVVSVHCLWNRLHSFNFLGEAFLTAGEHFIHEITAGVLFVRITKVLFDTPSKGIDAASQLFGIVGGNELFEVLRGECRFRG